MGCEDESEEGPLLSWLRTTSSLGKGACLNTRKLYAFNTVRLKRRYGYVPTKSIESSILHNLRPCFITDSNEMYDGQRCQVVIPNTQNIFSGLTSVDNQVA